MEYLFWGYVVVSIICIVYLAQKCDNMLGRLEKLENNVFYTPKEMKETFRRIGIYWTSELSMVNKLASAAELAKVAEQVGLLADHLKLRYEASGSIPSKFVKKASTSRKV